MQRALVAGTARVALLYAAATLAAALAAAWTGVWLATLVFRLRASGAVGDDSAADDLATDVLAEEGAWRC